MTSPTKAALVRPARRLGRSTEQGGVAFSVVLILHWILSAAWHIEMPAEVFGAAVVVLTALGSYVHARIQP